jgi:AcrR family transcriptional regulator
MAAPRKDDVREIILNTTEALLESKALADISLAEIARVAGISKGTLYYRYKTKDDILLALTERYLSVQRDDLLRWTEDKSKDTSLSRLVRYVAERDVDRVGIRMHLIYSAMLGNETLKRKLAALYEDFAALIAQKIAERTDAVPADYLTWLILLASDGLIIQKTLQSGNLDADAFIRQSAELVKRLK